MAASRLTRRAAIARLSIGAAAASAFGAWAGAADDEDALYDRWGGWRGHAFERTGRFALREWRGGWWFVSPEGHPMVVMSVSNAGYPREAGRAPGDTTEARFGGDRASYYKDLEEWLIAHGFNAFSGFTGPNPAPPNFDDHLPGLAELWLIPAMVINGPAFIDPYDPVWRADIRATIGERVAQSRRRRVIGYMLSGPQLISPHMPPAYMWERLQRAPTNMMAAIKAGTTLSRSKLRYLEFLEAHYGDFDAYRVARGAPAHAGSFFDLRPVNLAAGDDPFVLDPVDALFYREMWSDLIGFMVEEIRDRDPEAVVFAPRIAGARAPLDDWTEAFVAAAAPHVDGFAVMVNASDPYAEVVEAIGALSGKPVFVGPGLRLSESVYGDQAGDEAEAAAYARMLTELLGSRWFVGGAVAEYRDRVPYTHPAYVERPGAPRIGVRVPDYADRAALAATFRVLHADVAEARLTRLAGGE